MGDKGIAIGVNPSQGLLPPGGSFHCVLDCTTDMCGDYADTLYVQVCVHCMHVSVYVCVCACQIELV